MSTEYPPTPALPHCLKRLTMNPVAVFLFYICLLCACPVESAFADDVFRCEKQGTPAARITQIHVDGIKYRTDPANSSGLDLLKDLQNSPQTSSSPFEDVFSIINTSLGFSGNAFTLFTLADSSLGSSAKMVLPAGEKMVKLVNMNKILKANPKFFPDPILFKKANIAEVVSRDTFVGKLGKAFQAAGLATLAVQAADLIAATDENRDKMFYEVVKGIVSNAAGMFGTAGLQVAFVGAFAIDYALNSFGEEALRQHKEDIRQVCMEYIRNKRSVKDWEKRLLEIQNKMDMKGRSAKASVVMDHEFLLFAQNFWSDSDSAIETLRLEKFPRKEEQDALTQEMVIELKRYLAEEGVFARLQMRTEKKLLQASVEQMTQLAKDLNRKGIFRISEALPEQASDAAESAQPPKPHYAGYTAWLHPRDGKPDPAWSFTLGENGSGSLEYSMLGYMQKGFPTRLSLYAPGTSPESGEAEVVLDNVRVGFPSMEIVLPAQKNEAISVEGTYIFQTSVLSAAKGLEVDTSPKKMTVTTVANGLRVCTTDKKGKETCREGAFDPASGIFTFHNPQRRLMGFFYDEFMEIVFSGSGDSVSLSGRTRMKRLQKAPKKGKSGNVIKDAVNDIVTSDAWDFSSEKSLTGEKVASSTPPRPAPGK